MVDLLEQLFSVIWQEEIVPRQWREGGGDCPQAMEGGPYC